MNILLIGKDRDMLETLMAGVRARGLAIDGTTDMQTASEQFDAGDFDVVAFGGGLGPPLRARLKSDFKAQNPDVLLLDVFAPIAVEQIDRASRGDLDKREYASRFELVQEPGAYVVHLDIIKETDVRVQVYHLGDTLDVTTSVERHASPGPVQVRLDHAEIRPGANMILVTFNEREFHFERIEHGSPGSAARIE